jgi:hypothetical protein
MAMELYVLFDNALNSIAEWQQAIDAEGFALRSSTDTPLQRLNGFLTTQLRGKRTGFECAHWDSRKLLTENPRIDFGHTWKHALAFRWGADLYASPAAYMAGAAYAKATDGVVLDCEENKIFTPERAAQVARDLDKGIPAVEAAVRAVISKFSPKS